MIKYYTGQVLSGTDPEIFVADPLGEIIPAWTFLPSKRYSDAMGTSLKVYWDGMQAEISTTHGYRCHGVLVHAIAVGIKTILKVAPERSKLFPADVVIVPAKILRRAEDQYIILGCAPSANAYNTFPLYIGEPRKLKYRFAGTHLHYSVNSTRKFDPHDVVQTLDLITGPIFTAMGAGLENPIRRRYYGKAGEFRYDRNTNRLEYRVPGNFLMNSPALLHFGLDVGRMAFRYALQNHTSTFKFLPPANNLINNCDAKEARTVIRENQGFFTEFFQGCYNYEVVDNTMKLLLSSGIKSHLKNINTEWDRDTRWSETAIGIKC